MPDANKPEDSEGQLGASSDWHGPGSTAQAGAVAGDTGVDDTSVEAAGDEAPAGGDVDAGHASIPDADISEFAENVVSGLEQVRIGFEDVEGTSLAASGGALNPDGPETFSEEWVGLESPAQSNNLAEHEASLANAQPFPASGPDGDGQDDADGSERTESSEAPAFGGYGTQTLAEMGLASFAAFDEFPASPNAGISKHDELAEAVQSALLSIYGVPQGQGAEPSLNDLALQGKPAVSSLAWKGSSEAGFASPPNDGLSPQDVILNYFDYSLNPQIGNGSGSGALGMASAYEDGLPVALTGRSEASAQQKGRALAADPPPSPEWRTAANQAAQYSGPPAFPVPAAPGIAMKPAASAAQDSSRLLGAAAIGLMGGIAIAASLAAFLIYGPHPSAVDIPGAGILRADKDEQGYGRVPSDEMPKDPMKGSAIRASGEFSSEVLGADAFAVAGEPSPLAISVKSQRPFEQTLISISGIPDGGRLNAGIDVGGGTWLLPPRRLTGLTINLPVGVPDTIPLEAQLLDSNARTPLSPKGSFAIHLRPTGATTSAAQSQDIRSLSQAFAPKQAQQPATQAFAFNTQTVSQTPAGTAALSGSHASDASFRTQTVAAGSPPPQLAAPFQASLVPEVAPAIQDGAKRRANPRPEVEDLIREGNKRMREGDILEARQFYEKAVALGDPDAALAMGRSYDPIYFARLDKKNAEPDAAKAFDWYRRAMDAGAAQTAMVRIENLKHFLNE